MVEDANGRRGAVSAMVEDANGGRGAGPAMIEDANAICERLHKRLNAYDRRKMALSSDSGRQRIIT